MQEEISKAEIVAYYRGKYSEYIRHHELTPEEHHALRQWVYAGNDVHDNPWGLRTDKIPFRLDYIDAYRIINN